MFNSLMSAFRARNSSESIKAREISRKIKHGRAIVKYDIDRMRKMGSNSTNIWHSTLSSEEVYGPIIEELKGLGYSVEIEDMPSVSIMGTVSHTPYITITW